MFAGFCLPNYCIYAFTCRTVSPFCQAQRWSGQGHLTTSGRGQPGHDTGLPGRSPSRRRELPFLVVSVRGIRAPVGIARHRQRTAAGAAQSRPTRATAGPKEGLAGRRARQAVPPERRCCQSREHKAAGPGRPRSCTRGRAPPGESSASKSPEAAAIPAQPQGTHGFVGTSARLKFRFQALRPIPPQTAQPL